MKQKILFSFFIFFLTVNLSVEAQYYTPSRNDNMVRDLDITPDVIEPVVDNTDSSTIDWTEQYVEATGYSVIDNQRFPIPAQAMLMARRGAVVVAQRNLLEIVKGVRVVGETTVEDMITTNDYVYSRVDGVLKGAEMVGDYREQNGYVEVTLRVSIYEPNGLAPAVYNGLRIEPSEEQGTITPEELQLLPRIVVDVNNNATNNNSRNQQPPIFPKIVDNNGNVILDLARYYDPTTGSFPQVISGTETIRNEFGYEVQVLNAITNSNGDYQVDIANNDVWKKRIELLKKVVNISKYLLLLL